MRGWRKRGRRLAVASAESAFFSMIRPQDTRAAQSAKSLAGDSRRVFWVQSPRALAEVAEQILDQIQLDWQKRPPAWILVEEQVHSALVDHLHRRMVALDAIEVGSAAGPVAEPDPEAAEPTAIADLASLIRAALDGGATLIAGGVAQGSHSWQPSLLVNLPADSTLLEATTVHGPVVAVIRTSARRTAQTLLDRLPAGTEPVQFVPGAHLQAPGSASEKS
jgi:hypothetical protein